MRAEHAVPTCRKCQSSAGDLFSIRHALSQVRRRSASIFSLGVAALYVRKDHCQHKTPKRSGTGSDSLFEARAFFKICITPQQKPGFRKIGLTRIFTGDTGRGICNRIVSVWGALRGSVGGDRTPFGLSRPFRDDSVHAGHCALAEVDRRRRRSFRGDGVRRRVGFWSAGGGCGALRALN